MKNKTVVLPNYLPILSQIDDNYSLEVAILQRILAFYGYLSGDAVNGIFGASTDNAVRQFQHDNALYEDGTVGPHTWNMLANLTLAG